MSDLDSLDIFIKQHYVSLCAVAKRFVSDDDTAKDIAQEVIIKYWEQNLHSNQNISTEGLLFVMIKNAAMNHVRGAERRETRHQKSAEWSIESPQIMNILIEEQTNQILVDAINSLPIQSAKIMRLVLSGFKNEEIAKLLDVSINTIKTMKYISIKKLREYFTRNGYSELDFK